MKISYKVPKKSVLKGKRGAAENMKRIAQNLKVPSSMSWY